MPLPKIEALMNEGEPKNKTPQDFDPEELRKGIDVEYEHTKNVLIAQKIAFDHLLEDPQYYTKLDKAGLAD